MVIVKIENHYHDTIEIEEGASLEEVKQNHISGLEFTAENLTENEIEEDWQDWYETYEEEWNATYKLILEQLVSEVSFTVVD